jgi:acyclic terpene utilization AtuA family protein
MAAQKSIRIGSSAAAWGDTIHGARQLIENGNLDYLVGDYLAEVTMAILARMKAKDPDGGFVPDWLASVRPLLRSIKDQGIKLVTNSGGMNPLACRDAFMAAAKEAGIEFRVAVLAGDDLTPMENKIRSTAPTEMFNGNDLPENLTSMNAYLGATGIAKALAAGADVVITGRVVDSAMVLGPLMHEFGWRHDQFDLLAAGSLAGHIIECGAQATGGLFTDWEEVADGWDDMGFPIVECAADGEFSVSKPAGTGGKVSVGTVAEQMLYEIGDPRAYVLPDVTCDFSQVKITEISPDLVLVTGVRGKAPSPTYKVCATYADGFRIIVTYMLAGWQAARKARKMAEALVRRSERLMKADGFGGYREISIEVIGAGETYGKSADDSDAREVVVKIGLRHKDRNALGVFAREFAVPAVSMAQGVTGVFGGRPIPSPVIRVHSFLIEKKSVPVALWIDDKERRIDSTAFEDIARSERDDREIETAPIPENGAEVPLHALVWGRSGDKGNHANIGLIARLPEFAPYVKAQITEALIGDFFAHYLECLDPCDQVTRFELPGINAFNFLLQDVLGGGGTASLRYDPQAKTYAQMLLDLPVTVPAEWLSSEGPLSSFGVFDNGD